jgi:hypothetical protein
VKENEDMVKIMFHNYLHSIIIEEFIWPFTVLLLNYLLITFTYKWHLWKKYVDCWSSY